MCGSLIHYEGADGWHSRKYAVTSKASASSSRMIIAIAVITVGWQIDGTMECGTIQYLAQCASACLTWKGATDLTLRSVLWLGPHVIVAASTMSDWCQRSAALCASTGLDNRTHSLRMLSAMFE